MKISAYIHSASRYPPPPRYIGIIELEGNCKVIYWNQRLTGKILDAKDLGPDSRFGGLHCRTTSGRAIMRHIGIVRKVRCHNGSVTVSTVGRFGGLAHAGAVERDIIF